MKRTQEAERMSSSLRIPAIEVRQGSHRLYSFAVDGKLLSKFTTISRVRRSDGRQAIGYQRPEVLSHIAEIRNYLESDSPMVPNAIVLAFDRRVTFESTESEDEGLSRSGHLNIPLAEDAPDHEKPAWIVDGQQRTAAVRDARIERFPLCAVGFLAESEQEQCEQFILVNSTKPLPKGLIYELLPRTEATLPSLLERRRFPAALLERLNHDDDSPLRHRIKTPTNPGGVIKDNSILKFLENSLSDGVLYRFTGDEINGTELMLKNVKSFWEAVAEVFPQAWSLPPRRSRLVHGAGVVSMGFVMDAIADRHRGEPAVAMEHHARDLAPLAPICRWTDGYWDFGPGAQRKWNEIQNTSKDIQLLSNYLLLQYRALVWDAGKRALA